MSESIATGETRQQILILHLAAPELDAKTIAWALYDGSKPKGEKQMQTGDSDVPPYGSVLDAMRDGWNVIQLATMPVFRGGHEFEQGHLPYEYVLERKVAKR
ncbi:hypothetical protein [Paenibacillus cymbidii]|uniref:hypothetical protein n=1 Tax=Paenibacillus cymbidii TaxID=1639034 RepID=UPI001080F1F2|nr:hypothetical protein [Paenibacillus cymbidii]